MLSCCFCFVIHKEPLHGWIFCVCRGSSETCIDTCELVGFKPSIFCMMCFKYFHSQCVNEPPSKFSFVCEVSQNFIEAEPQIGHENLFFSVVSHLSSIWCHSLETSASVHNSDSGSTHPPETCLSATSLARTSTTKLVSSFRPP